MSTTTQTTQTNDKVLMLASKLSELDLVEVINRACEVLTPKEIKVLWERFNLHGNGAQTLESIGRSLKVTRERVRQVQEVALQKLSRTIKSTEIYLVVQLAKEIAVMNGGILTEKDLIAKILNTTAKQGVVNGQIIKLALTASDSISLSFKRGIIERSWYLSTYDRADVLDIASAAFSILCNLVEEVPVLKAELVNKSYTKLSKKFPKEFIAAVVKCDLRMKEVNNDSYGLLQWRSVYPRSLKDKAMIVLQESQRPLHFTEITNLINEEEFDSRVANVPAVHNELIRHSRKIDNEEPVFRLVGRGKYALANWGMAEGRVMDVIMLVLKEAGRPLSREEVVARVMQLREARPNTIILNLQRNPEIKRPARGLYAHPDYREEHVTFSVAPLSSKTGSVGE